MSDEISGDDFVEKHADQKDCFVIAPIGSKGSKIRRRADNLVDEIIERAIGDLGFKVTRADHDPAPGNITDKIIRHLLEDELVIADLTHHNPNVFYELAVRHASEKPYIHMIDHEEDIPFDVSKEDTIKFDISDLKSAEQCRQTLRKRVKIILEDGFEARNPIGQGADLKARMESTDPETQQEAVLIEEVRTMKRQLDQLKETMDDRDNLRPLSLEPSEQSEVDTSIGERYEQTPSLNEMDMGSAVENSVARAVRKHAEQIAENIHEQQTDFPERDSSTDGED